MVGGRPLRSQQECRSTCHGNTRLTSTPQGPLNLRAVREVIAGEVRTSPKFETGKGMLDRHSPEIIPRGLPNTLAASRLMKFCPPGGQNSASPELFFGAYHEFWCAQFLVHTALFDVHRMFWCAQFLVYTTLFGVHKFRRTPLFWAHTTLLAHNNYFGVHKFGYTPLFLVYTTTDSVYPKLYSPDFVPYTVVALALLAPSHYVNMTKQPSMLKMKRLSKTPTQTRT